MFQLTAEEFENLKCKFFTSSWGGRRKQPYAFTEQGIYMLMTVLRGELAVEQSRNLIRLFKGMKDFICGASSKDAGKRITSIMRVKDISNYKEMIKDLLTNPPLALK